MGARTVCGVPGEESVVCRSWIDWREHQNSNSRREGLGEDKNTFMDPCERLCSLEQFCGFRVFIV